MEPYTVDFDALYKPLKALADPLDKSKITNKKAFKNRSYHYKHKKPQFSKLERVREVKKQAKLE